MDPLINSVKDALKNFEPNTVNITSIVLVTLFTLFAIFWIYANRKLSYWKRRGVDQLDNVDLIFGNMKDAVLFRTPPGVHLGKLYNGAKKDAPFLGFYIFHKPCLLLRDPEIIKHVLIRDFENFSDRHFAGAPQKDSIGMRNLFGLKNPAWKYLRTKITQTLTRTKLKQMFPLMTEIGDNMMQYLGRIKEGPSGKIVDGQELSYTYASDLMTSVGMGTPIDSFNRPIEEFIKNYHKFYHSTKRMIALVTVFFIPELVAKLGSNILFDSSFFKRVFWTAMDKREKTGEKRGDFIDSLLQLKNGEQNPVYKFEGENLMYQSGTFFSGFESSSTTTAFTMMELAKHKEYQDKARKDILRAIEEHGWTYEAMNDMKYLNQCIGEAVRLHPPVSTIDRKTKDDYKIPGTNVVIESGTPIYISLYGVQLDPKYFEEPEVFNPERFEGGTKISEAYIPFGIGPRMCVGMQVGQLHAKVVLSHILKDYEIYQNPTDENVLDSRSTFTAAANGISLQFRKL